MPKIRIMPSGVPGLDPILGGGFPEYSFNMVVGHPGTGKTTLAGQILFANATDERQALYITLAGEPSVKMLRYQQQFSHFDTDKIGRCVHLVNLEEDAVTGDLDSVLSRIEKEIARVDPRLVVVDSLTGLRGLSEREPVNDGARLFARRLAMFLTRWEATSFLIAEFKEVPPPGPIGTVADGVIHVSQVWHEDSVVRKLGVLKLRGQREIPGLHPFRITGEGLRVYPRVGLVRGDRMEVDLAEADEGDWSRLERVSLGVPGVDEMTGGGVLRGDSLMISGPSGSGKSVLGMHFVKAGLEAGERVVVATFEEPSSRYVHRAKEIGIPVEERLEDGTLRMYHKSLSDLSVSEAFSDVRHLVEEIGATRVLVDSLNGLEISVSDPSERRVREAVFRSVRALNRSGVTVAMVSETPQTGSSLRLTPHEMSVLADDVILQRYVEIRGRLESVLTVVKMRRSGHSRQFHRYTIEDDGLHVGESLHAFHGVLTGVPQLLGEAEHEEEADGVGGAD